jgi:hypothetical protein
VLFEETFRRLVSICSLARLHRLLGCVHGSHAVKLHVNECSIKWVSFRTMASWEHRLRVMHFYLQPHSYSQKLFDTAIWNGHHFWNGVSFLCDFLFNELSEASDDIPRHLWNV